MSKFSFYKQHDTMDFEATCLRMIAKYYGKNYSLGTYAVYIFDRQKIGNTFVIHIMP
ncbi:MAG: hypothetical protein LBV02_03350 [Bacteroidales bacterium]|jgi:ABC-type bacteriocin/lantibiotic exporter with double-glycine peptidase domain|nr:hypothetical protein [Bacteroidales bacterium]